jgi:hypothetical protein
MREDSGNLEAARALNVHEETVGSLDETLKLVKLSLIFGRGVEEVVIDLGERGKIIENEWRRYKNNKQVKNIER